jgi:hypothetical protein
MAANAIRILAFGEYVTYAPGPVHALNPKALNPGLNPGGHEQQPDMQNPSVQFWMFGLRPEVPKHFSCGMQTKPGDRILQQYSNDSEGLHSPWLIQNKGLFCALDPHPTACDGQAGRQTAQPARPPAPKGPDG